MSQLTAVQRRVLDDIREAGGAKKFNGRRRRTIEALQAAGYVHVDYDMRPQTKGGGIQLVQVITVRLAGDTDPNGEPTK